MEWYLFMMNNTKMANYEEYKPDTIEIPESIISDYDYWRTQDKLDARVAIKNIPEQTTTPSLLLIWA